MVPRNTDYKYSDGRMFLVRLDDSANPTIAEAIEFISGKKDFYARDIHFECNLQPGTYGIFAEIDWCLESKPAKNQFVVTCYGPSKIYFTNDTQKYSKQAVVSAALLSIMYQGESVEQN